jgi:hypothetical protein
MAEVIAAIDYLPQVRSKVTVSVHGKLLSAAGMSIHYPQLEQLGARGARGNTKLWVMNDGSRLSCSTYAHLEPQHETWHNVTTSSPQERPGDQQVG